VDLDASALTARVRAEERRRLVARTLDQPLPKRLILPKEQRQDWAGRWGKATRDAPIGFEDALALASALVDPVLFGATNGARWSAEQKAWTGTP
jgi:hypothetical protein